MKHRTRAENVARKTLRLINAARRDKKARAGPAGIPAKSLSKRVPTPLVGERFDKLLAVESAGVDGRGQPRWTFECVCGQRVTMNVSTVRSNVRSLGWCSCRSCYFAAGGWDAIAQRHAPSQETDAS